MYADDQEHGVDVREAHPLPRLSASRTINSTYVKCSGAALCEG